MLAGREMTRLAGYDGGRVVLAGREMMRLAGYDGGRDRLRGCCRRFT